jgi:hypothetical protein
MGGEAKKWKLAREGEKKTKTAKEEVEKVKKEAEETFEVGYHIVDFKSPDLPIFIPFL